MTALPKADPGWWVIRHAGGTWTAFRNPEHANVACIRLRLEAPVHWSQLPAPHG